MPGRYDIEDEYTKQDTIQNSLNTSFSQRIPARSRYFVHRMRVSKGIKDSKASLRSEYKNGYVGITYQCSDQLQRYRGFAEAAPNGPRKYHDRNNTEYPVSRISFTTIGCHPAPAVSPTPFEIRNPDECSLNKIMGSLEFQCHLYFPPFIKYEK